MSADPAAVLARWQPALELIASMPVAITADLVNARLLADVSRLVTPEESPVELRVLLLRVAPHQSSGLAGRLADRLAGSVLGACPVLAEVRLPTDLPAAVVREQVAGAHAVVIAVGYYELVGAERGEAPARRLAAGRGWLAQAARLLSTADITIAVDGRTTQRSDPASRADWIHLMAVEKLGMPRDWPANVIMETAVGSDLAPLADRVLRPFRTDLDEAFVSATLSQVRQAIRDTQQNCEEIRRMAGLITPAPAELRWTWLQALAACRLAATMARTLEDTAGSAASREPAVPRVRRNGDHLRLPLLAGWLFADLFVVLFIIGLASGVVAKPSSLAGQTPMTSPLSSPSPSRSAPATSQPLMRRKPDTIDLPLTGNDELQQLYADPGNDGALLRVLKNDVAGQGKAGFVLVFLPGTDPETAQKAAQALFSALPWQDPAIFGEASGEGLWNGDVSYVELQIFFTGS